MWKVGRCYDFINRTLAIATTKVNLAGVKFVPGSTDLLVAVLNYPATLAKLTAVSFSGKDSRQISKPTGLSRLKFLEYSSYLLIAVAIKLEN